MKRVIIDADFETSELWESYIIAAEKKLNILDQIYANRVFTHHEDAYDYFLAHHSDVGAYFIKIDSKTDLDYLKRLKTIHTEAVFMVFSENNELNQEFLDLTIEGKWTHALAHSAKDLEKLIERLFTYVFTNCLKTVSVGDTELNLDSILYVETYKKNRNYLSISLKNNECLVRLTLGEFRKLGRGLIVNPRNIRRIENDGLTLCFKDCLKKIKAPQICKKQIESLK